MQFRIQGLIAITIEAAIVFALMKLIKFQSVVAATMFLVLFSPILIRPLTFCFVAKSKRQRFSVILHSGILIGSTATFAFLAVRFNGYEPELLFGLICYMAATLLVWAPQIFVFWYLQSMYIDGLRAAGIHKSTRSEVESTNEND